MKGRLDVRVHARYRPQDRQWIVGPVCDRAHMSLSYVSQVSPVRDVNYGIDSSEALA